MRTLVHLEHFHDHVRVEDEVFVGAPAPQGGVLHPSEHPGLGLEVRT
jgi:L-alanine-DL-glutamate epimerase-like enolase superfamily enzyme